jgi:hypothetical protein
MLSASGKSQAHQPTNAATATNSQIPATAVHLKNARFDQALDLDFFDRLPLEADDRDRSSRSPPRRCSLSRFMGHGA